MSGIWPGDIQCVAMLTFDVDGVSSWLRRDPKYGSLPSLMSMAEYGPSVAAPRILDLLDRHAIKASFYVPGYVAESHQDLISYYVRFSNEKEETLLRSYFPNPYLDDDLKRTELQPEKLKTFEAMRERYVGRDGIIFAKRPRQPAK